MACAKRASRRCAKVGINLAPLIGSHCLLADREPVMKPFSKILFSQMLADGPDAGVLGITSLTMYNTDSTDSFINVYATQVVGPTCASTPIDAGSRYLFFFRVPSGSTFHATFPSPLVVEPIPGAVNGLTCIRFKGTTNTLSIMMVNGFVN